MEGFLQERRGQFSIEYLLAFVLFSIVILYVSFQTASLFPEIFAEREASRKDSMANRIGSHLAENNRGFARKPYLWSEEKINEFQERCNEDYERVREELGLGKTSGVVVTLSGEEDKSICGGPSVPSGVSLGTSRRFGYVEEEDDIKILEVIVW